MVHAGQGQGAVVTWHIDIVQVAIVAGAIGATMILMSLVFAWALCKSAARGQRGWDAWDGTDDVPPNTITRDEWYTIKRCDSLCSESGDCSGACREVE